MIIVLAAALATPLWAAARPPLRGPAAYAVYKRLYERLESGETAKDLEDVLPGLTADMKTAVGVSQAYWSDCTPYDELAKADILPAPVMARLGIHRSVDGGVAHAPAGLMHTYGYLFSQLRTSFGLKGKRWLESRLDERLGLPAGTFSPAPPEGEFASNVTAALLAVTGSRARLPRASKAAPKAAEAGYVEQRVSWLKPDGTVAAGVARTHLVPLAPLKDLESADAYLLVYELVTDGRSRLVTAFPIDAGFAKTFLDAQPAKGGAFAPRFNLYVDPAWKPQTLESLGWVAAAVKK